MYVWFFTGPYTFSIGDTTGFSPYTKGGLVTKVKMPKKLKFVSVIVLLYKKKFAGLDIFKNV